MVNIFATVEADALPVRYGNKEVYWRGSSGVLPRNPLLPLRILKVCEPKASACRSAKTHRERLKPDREACLPARDSRSQFVDGGESFSVFLSVCVDRCRSVQKF